MTKHDFHNISSHKKNWEQQQMSSLFIKSSMFKSKTSNYPLKLGDERISSSVESILREILVSIKMRFLCNMVWNQLAAGQVIENEMPTKRLRECEGKRPFFLRSNSRMLILQMVVCTSWDLFVIQLYRFMWLK